MLCSGKFFDDLEKERDEDVKKYIRENYSILLTISSLDLDFTEKYRFWTILLMVYNYGILINEDWMLYYSWFLLKSDFDAASGVGNYGCLQCLAIIFITNVTCFRTTILRLFKSAATGIYEYPEPQIETEDMAMLRNFLRLQHKMLMILAVYVCWIGVLAILGPVIDEKLGLGFEETYDQNGVNRKLPVPLYIPYDTSGWLGYIVAVGLTTVSGLATCAVMGSISLIFTTMSQFILMELKKLCSSLKCISYRAKRKYCKRFGVAKESLNRKQIYDNPDFQKCLTECIKENIQHHQKIKIFFGGFRRFAKVPLIACCTIVTLAIALSMVKVNQGVTRPGSSIAFASVALGELFNVFNLCICGQLLVNLSQELHWEIYFTPWYKFSIQNQKLISQFLLSTRTPIKLDAWIVAIDMEMFSSMMNSAYSFFNFLKLSDNIHSQ